MSYFGSDGKLGSSEMVEVRWAEIPAYLQSGEFYRSLSANDDADSDFISIPSNTLKADLQVNNEKDLLHLLSSLRFWGVNDIPDELIAFCLSPEAAGCHFSLREFAADFEYVGTLIQVIDAKWKENVEIITKSGNIALLDYLRRSGCFFKNAGTFAVQADLPHVLRYLQEQNQPLPHWLLLVAFHSNSIGCVKYFHENGWPWPFDPLGTALVQGHLQILQYAYEHGAAWETDDFESNFMQAIYNGHLQCIQYAHEHGCPHCSNAMCEAARVGNIEILTYLHSAGFVWDAQVCAVAAGCGHLECLQYLHEAGCPWDETTLKNAPTLEIVQYAHEHGCPWNVEVTMAAVGPGGMNKLSYLVETDVLSRQLCAKPPQRSVI